MTRSVLLALALVPIAGAALAQPATSFAPQLFGVIDVGARALRNGSSGTYKSESTDGLSSSRLGFRGNEDLGDGLKANFWLESSLQPDTGTTSTKFFNRRSTVSLVSPTLGEIRLGRDNTPLKLSYDIYDPFGTNGLGEIVGNGAVGAVAANGTVATPGTGIISALGSGSGTLTRADNQVSYILPTQLGGVYCQISAAPSEGTVGNRYVGGRLGYSKGPFDISVGYEDTRVALDDRFKQAHVGASYNFGVLVLTGQFLQSRYDSAAGGNRKQQVAQAGVIVPFGANVVRASYIHGDMSGGRAGSGFGDDDDADQLSLGYQYNLSKRTALYTVASQLRNKGSSRQVLASSGRTGFRPGEKSTGVDFGVRHSF